MGDTRPITVDAVTTRKAGACVFGFVGLLGLVLLVFFFVLPALRVARAAGWTETPCRVLASTVREHSSRKGGTTYSIQVSYEYEAAGGRRTSDRYSFEPFTSSSGSASKREIVNAIPPGTRTVCYVDPRDPSFAVLNRRLTSGLFLAALVPLAFLIVGVFGMVVTRRSASTQTEAAWDRPAGPRRLHPKGGWSTVFPLALTAVIGNGLVWGLLMPGWRPPDSGSVFGWFNALLILLFPIAGAASLVAAVYRVLQRFNPPTSIEVSRGDVAVGESFDIEWRTAGKLNRVTEFEIRLEGIEETTLSGKKRRTWNETFESILIAGSDSVHGLASGRGSVRVPADTMHSLTAGLNKIRWVVRVRAGVRMRPDVNEEFPIEILPAPVTSGAAT